MAEKEEAEMAENSWLTIPASSELLFDTEPSLRWEKAAQQLGVNMQQITGSGSIGYYGTSVLYGFKIMIIFLSIFQKMSP